MTAIQSLIEQHHTCDNHFAEAEKAIQHKRWDEGRKHWQCFVEDMRLHFDREETVLFPAFEQATGITQGPTAVMRYEHEEMRQLIADSEMALQSQDASAFLGLCETLLVMMQQHNLKEENVLYPMAASRISNLDVLLHE